MIMASTIIAAVAKTMVKVVAEAAVRDVVGAKTTTTINQTISRIQIHPCITTATSIIRTII